jgi:hypothetical protein
VPLPINMSFDGSLMDDPPDPVDIAFNYINPEDHVCFSDFAISSPIDSVIVVWGARALSNVSRSSLLNTEATRKLERFRSVPHCSIVVFDGGGGGGSTDDGGDDVLLFGGAPTLVYNIAHVLGKLPPGIEVDKRRLAFIFARKRASYAHARRAETITARMLVLNAPFHVTQDIARLGGADSVFYVRTGDDMNPMFPLLVGSARFQFSQFNEVLTKFVATTKSTVCPGCLLRDMSITEESRRILCYEDTFDPEEPIDRGHWCCATCYAERVYPKHQPDETVCYCPSPEHRGRYALIYAPQQQQQRKVIQ